MSLAAAAGAVSKSVRDILAEREEKRIQATLEAARAQQMTMQQEAAQRAAEMQRATLEDRSRGRQIEEAGIRLEGMAPNQSVEGADLAAITGTPYESRLERRQTLPSRTIAAAGGAQMEDAGGQDYSTLRPTAEQQEQINLISNLRRIEDDPNTAPTLKRIVGLKRVGVNASAEDVETPQERAARLAEEDKRLIARTEATEGIQHRNRLAEIGATGEQTRRTASAKTADDSQATPYSQERARRTVESANALIGKVSNWTAGAGSLLSRIPATDARNFAAELDTLKGNVAFNELAQMREASKTGGALGSVAVREMELLQSTLGALDPGQSPANLKTQLEKVRDSVTRWQMAQSGMAAPGRSEDAGGGGVQRWGRDAQGKPVRVQ